MKTPKILRRHLKMQVDQILASKVLPSNAPTKPQTQCISLVLASSQILFLRRHT